MSCKRFEGRVGYKGQQYVVVATSAATKQVEMIGWQNEPEGGLADMVNVYQWPQFQASSARVLPACTKCGDPSHDGPCPQRSSRPA